MDIIYLNSQKIRQTLLLSIFYAFTQAVSSVGTTCSGASKGSREYCIEALKIDGEHFSSRRQEIWT